MIKHFLKLFSYDNWANHESLSSLKNAGSPPERAVKFFAHIIAAQSVWLTRLKAENQKVVVWPDWTLAQCQQQLGELHQEWQPYLTALTNETLAQSITYSNTKGEPWS